MSLTAKEVATRVKNLILERKQNEEKAKKAAEALRNAKIDNIYKNAIAVLDSKIYKTMELGSEAPVFIDIEDDADDIGLDAVDKLTVYYEGLGYAVERETWQRTIKDPDEPGREAEYVTEMRFLVSWDHLV